METKLYLERQTEAYLSVKEVNLRIPSHTAKEFQVLYELRRDLEQDTTWLTYNHEELLSDMESKTGH